MSMNINGLSNTYNSINTNSKQYKALKEKGWLSGVIENESMMSPEEKMIYEIFGGRDTIIKNLMKQFDSDGDLLNANGVAGMDVTGKGTSWQKLTNVSELDLLCQTPASALGSCRVKLKDPAVCADEYETIISVLRKYNIDCFIYIGGNDSMDTVDKLSKYLNAKGITDITVVGAPKTIDNDLCGTDHCPGFGSAAKYIGTTFAELERDCHVYATKAVTIVEVMGRDAGWLTAASCLARANGAKGPDFIYLCEVPFSIDTFLKDVKAKLHRNFSGQIKSATISQVPSGKYYGRSRPAAFCAVWGGRPKGEPPLANFKLHAARVRVCVGLAALAGVRCGIGGQPVLEVGVVCEYRSAAFSCDDSK